jgi:hypothetical protein
VRSTPGAGSTFSVFLPVAPGTPAQATITGRSPTRCLPPRAEPEPGEPPHR